MCFRRRSDRVRGLAERDEERVPLRVDLDASVPLERIAEQGAVLCESDYVAVTELLEEASRAFDVGEDERDGPGR